MYHRLTRPLKIILILVAAFALIAGGVALYAQTTAGPTPTVGGGSLRQPVANGNGLVAWWKLDGDTKDATSNHNDGTLTNSPTAAQGKFGNAYQFNGTSNYISIPTSSNLDFNYNVDFSVSFWEKFTSGSTGQTMLEKWDQTGNPYPYAFRIATGGYADFKRYDLTHNPTVDSVTAINDGNWHHIVGQRSSGTLKLYVDGILSSSASDTTSTTTTNSSNIYVGARGNPCCYFPGAIDDVRIYNRALSAAEIQQIYNGSAPANVDQKTTGYYKLNENTGTSAGNGFYAPSNLTPATLNNFSFGGSDGWRTGQVGGALLFDGVSDYALATANTSLNSPKTAITMSAWVYSPAGSGNNLLSVFSKGLSGGHNGYGIVNNGSVLVCGVHTTGTSYGNAGFASISASTWHFLTCTYDSSTGIITPYLDGTKGTTGSASGTIIND